MKSRPASPTTAERVAGLDTLRALAIVCVMVFHLNWRLPPGFAIAGKFGWMGVDLFFVLSGYLIGSQLLRTMRAGERIDLLRFYRQRAYRILPAYLTVLAVYRLWPRWHEDDGMSPWWQFLTFTENLFVDYSKNHAFSHVWSLCVEEHFYLLLPLIVVLLARRPSWRKAAICLGLLALLGIAVRSYELVHVLRPLAATEDGFGTKYIERIYYPTYSRLDGLLCGLTAAIVWTFRPRWWAWSLAHANRLLLLGSALMGCAVWMFWGRFTSVTGITAVSAVAGFPVLSVGMALWLPAASDARCWLGRWRVPGARLLATLAFSLYLTHKEVASVLRDWIPSLAARSWVTVPAYAFACLAVAAVLYVTVERPFLILRDRRLRRSNGIDPLARAEPAL